jgi:solute carrier family 25 (mitochondrial folate transporter), member 32
MNIYKGLLSSLSTIIQKDGIKGIFVGLSPTLQASMVEKALWFPIYELTKKKLSTQLDIEPTNPLLHFHAAVSTSALTVLLTHPLWMVRTRIMLAETPELAYPSLYNGINTILRKEGVKGLYTGVGASMLGISNTAINIPVYEAMKNGLKGVSGSNECSNFDILLASSVSKLISTTITYPYQV